MAIQKIFLIDDDPLLNMLHRMIFNKSGFTGQLKIYENAKIAALDLKALKKEDFPDLIFLDLNMEPMDGWEFMDELLTFENAAFEECRIIILSSSIDAIDIERSGKYKIVCEFISKPLTVGQVKQIISDILKPVT